MDAIDRALLDLLRANARLSYAELARQVGLSAPSVHDRVGKLEASGVIRGYRTDVDPEAIGLGVTAMIMIVQESGHEIEDMAHRFRAQPEIEACWFMAGHESFLLLARLGTIAELEQLIGRINRVPGVASTKTTIALSTKWEYRPRPPREPPPPPEATT
ncbi:AsnC family transcriptional regulator [Pilimelia anulata]|uniref:AsnC family transcriptional regulator n=1 Tax=Pilimelia anulata TaxID=53371 RepID=A0A8J3B5I0_9ACTN|nr:Lrp/AsnC family transcriptional regulator [Pilimelia anulata]GGJ95147.1 AsnC family transcriptional regulator [Pilimelia anulata]